MRPIAPVFVGSFDSTDLYRHPQALPLPIPSQPPSPPSHSPEKTPSQDASLIPFRVCKHYTVIRDVKFDSGRNGDEKTCTD
ncbi:hypothetical protein BT96DRAFT_927425, partial [Gymnopus androsaceus JB14]